MSEWPWPYSGRHVITPCINVMIGYYEVMLVHVQLSRVFQVGDGSVRQQKNLSLKFVTH